MYKYLAALLLAGAVPFFAIPAHAQMMGAYSVVDDGHTSQEEAEGKEIFQQLNAGVLTCNALTDDNFERIGEYYMGLMVGDAHVSMNAMMTRQLGERGEEEMHVIMGERFSGCNPTAGNQNTVVASSWFPMMGMMNGISGSTWRNGMMSSGWNVFSLITTLLIWTVVILALIVLVRTLLQPKK